MMVFLYHQIKMYANWFRFNINGDLILVSCLLFDDNRFYQVKLTSNHDYVLF
jgi:hypothetical protein